jgi:hypothetical protein
MQIDDIVDVDVDLDVGLTLPDVLSDVHGVDKEDGGEVRVYGLCLWLVRSRNDIGEFCRAGGGLDFDGLRHQ